MVRLIRLARLLRLAKTLGIAFNSPGFTCHGLEWFTGITVNGKDTNRYQQMIQCVTKASTDHRVTYLHELFVVKWCDPAYRPCFFNQCFRVVCCLWMFWIYAELFQLLNPLEALVVSNFECISKGLIRKTNQGRQKPIWKANMLLSYSWVLARRQNTLWIYICLDNSGLIFSTIFLAGTFSTLGCYWVGAHFALCSVPLVRMLLACCRIWGGAASSLRFRCHLQFCPAMHH